jgi:hypothetical protein
MHEEPMRKAGVPPRKLPTLELVRDNAVRMRFRPYGLWIIGANGRIDLVKGSELYLVVDHSKTFEPPSWHISPATARRDPKPFNAQSMALLIA